MALDIWLVTDASDIVYGFLDIDDMIKNLSICLSKYAGKLDIRLRIIHSKLEIINLFLETNILKDMIIFFCKYVASEVYDFHL